MGRWLDPASYAVYANPRAPCRGHVSGPFWTSLVAPTSRAGEGRGLEVPNRIGRSDRHSRAPGPRYKALPRPTQDRFGDCLEVFSPRPGRPADRGERRGARLRWGTGPTESRGASGLGAVGRVFPGALLVSAAWRRGLQPSDHPSPFPNPTSGPGSGFQTLSS